jgi:hypothetical protein
MTLSPLPYHSLESLLQDNLSTVEDDVTELITMPLRMSKKKGGLFKSELEIICRLKSPKSNRLIMSNTSILIQNITTKVFQTRKEMLKIELLTQLEVVTKHITSAMLTFLNPTVMELSISEFGNSLLKWKQ